MLSNRIPSAPTEPSGRRGQDAVAPNSREAIEGGILHDLNNVFSSLSIATQLLKEEAPVERHRALLGSLAKATERGQRLLGELERHRDRENSEPIELDLQILLEAAVRAGRRHLGRSRTLVTEYESGLPRVFGDPDELFGLFFRMLLQAASTTPEEGSISLSCRLRRPPRRAGEPRSMVEVDIEHTPHGAGTAAGVRPLLAWPAMPADAELERISENRWKVSLPTLLT